MSGPARQHPSDPLLLPRPRSIEVPAGARPVPARPVEERIDPSLPPQGYRLAVSADGVRLQAADAAGFRHGRATLAQLGTPAAWPTADPVEGGLWPCTIEDWPDLPVRGVMLDVSRDKVPTMATLRAIVDQLAAWKLNHLELYFEHTFATAGHEEVWRGADPYTAEDLLALQDYCAARGVELSANQNTLGHFERWLRHDTYRHLAIAPDGFEWLFGIHRPPLTLDPAKPEAFALVADILGQLVPLLRSPRVHVGMDEPWELPPARRGEWAGWLNRLRTLPVLDGRELLVWGDVPGAHPELLAQVPQGVTVCEWGYEADHPFAPRLDRLAAAGVAAWACPGTSSWLSVTGRAPVMMANVANAAIAAVRCGATGLLVTDWGDMGHHQYLPFSDAGLAAAAALSWCVARHRDLGLDDLAAALSVHRYADPTGSLGSAVVRLGQVHSLVAPQPPNMSALVLHLLLPQWPVGTGLTTGLDGAGLDSVEDALAQATAAAGAASPGCVDAAVVVAEVANAAELLRLACHDARLRLAGDGTLGSVAAADRRRLARWLADIVDEHRRLWLARNRVGGLGDSVAWFDHLGRCYETGTADPGWFGPGG